LAASSTLRDEQAAIARAIEYDVPASLRNRLIARATGLSPSGS
jgi:hypothetical protein